MRFLLKIFAHLNIIIGTVLVLIPIAYLVIASTPALWYRINPSALADEVAAITKSPFSPQSDTLADYELSSLQTPAIDTLLPAGRRIVIPSLGVDTEINLDKDERTALSKGAWLMPDYGSPGNDLNMPIVISAHRWGSVTLSPEFRAKNLFINLPQLEIGNKIEIYWDQRKYVYQVVALEETDYVSRLSDLILITCKFINSPQRIIVYAERSY